MGIWDKIKSAKNYLTGGGAKLLVSIPDIPLLTKAFPVVVQIKIEDLDIEADKIYLLLRYTEIVSINVHRNNGNRNKSRTETRHNILHEEEIILDEMVLLNALDIYDYKTDIVLPPNSFPAFTGVNAKYIWSLQAYLEKSGNNPQSKTLEFEPIYSFEVS